ncbi:MAG: prepilin peptidase [bacterium]|nr:prepilin peptidase [bacterium]
MSIVLFILGLIIGSFLNVCIYRIPEGISVVNPRSFCPYCRRQLSWLDNIPVVSYLLLRGRCRYCGEKISIQYPLVELLTGIIFLLFYVKFGVSVKFILFVTISSLLIIAFFIDLKYMLLPDVVIIPSIILSAIYGGIYGFPHNFITAGIFTLIFYLLRVIFKGGLGVGDIELIFIFSLMLGLYGTLLVVIVSSLIGTIYGLYLIKKGRAGMKTKIPFGPFLIGAFILISSLNIPIFYLPH